MAKRTFKIMAIENCATITENSLLEGVVKALEGREVWRHDDQDSTDRGYSGEIFEAILGEDSETPKNSILKIKNKKVLAQLEELAKHLGGYEYIFVRNL